MKMNDEKFIDVLQNISRFCNNYYRCCDCEFYNEYGSCDCYIQELIRNLNNTPDRWDMERIKEIINE